MRMWSRPPVVRHQPTRLLPFPAFIRRTVDSAAATLPRPETRRAKAFFCSRSLASGRHPEWRPASRSCINTRNRSRTTRPRSVRYRRRARTTNRRWRACHARRCTTADCRACACRCTTAASPAADQVEGRRQPGIYAAPAIWRERSGLDKTCVRFRPICIDVWRQEISGRR
jgi:hypothetical protein